jgi:hypothetical protein
MLALSAGQSLNKGIEIYRKETEQKSKKKTQVVDHPDTVIKEYVFEKEA